MQLVDTNVLVGLFIANSPWHDAARRLHALDGEWRTERHALVEFSSVLTRLVRVGELPLAEARTLMDDVTRIFAPGALEAPHGAALALAVTLGLSAYDARFIVLAQTLEQPLVTEDSRLRAAAPERTLSVEAALDRLDGSDHMLRR